MVVRNDEYYTKLFNEFGYYDIKRHEFKKEGWLDEFMTAYILTKDV